ncbi:MAG: DNA methyltransferase, partial [Anaerolineales bacterium]
SLRFLDPACGCGNFLVIAYREVRELEIQVLKERFPLGQYELLDVATLSLIDVDQFYGIEINVSWARISEVALWMMDHIMNNRLSAAFGKAFARIPLQKSPHIHCADALEMDWGDVLPPELCSYILGNPPFVGQSFQSTIQRGQMRRTIGGNGRGGSLDYVAAWFITAASYLRKGAARVGFVATNSITQGEQVAQLWPLLFRDQLEITFAHRTFEWESEAKGKAHVHCVILGLARQELEPPKKRLFSYSNIRKDPTETAVQTLSPYLLDASRLKDRHLVVRERNEPLCDVQSMRMGCKIVDGGHFIFDELEREKFLRTEPQSADFMRPLLGSKQYINGGKRWVLNLENVAPDILRAMPLIMERISRVKEFRLKSKKDKTRELALTPTRFEVRTVPSTPFIAIPEVSSERRDYVPIGWLSPPITPSNLLHALQNAEQWHFAMLTSAMHMSWLRHIGGRLKSDFRYSIGLVYNTFPWPEIDENAKARLTLLAQAVLDARASHPNATLADLYDPDVMPPNLRKAHRELDIAVDRLYRKEPFSSDRERAEHLFTLYEKLTSGMLATINEKKKRAMSQP